MKLIYTARDTGFEPGKHYRNPRFFDRPEHGVTAVVVDGDWPDVVAAYEQAGVTVEVQGTEPEPKPKQTRKAAAKE